MKLGVNNAHQPLRGGSRVIGQQAGKVLGVTAVEGAQRLDQQRLVRTKMQVSREATSSPGFQASSFPISNMACAAITNLCTV
jgi:hypothetical protein